MTHKQVRAQYTQESTLKKHQKPHERWFSG